MKGLLTKDFCLLLQRKRSMIIILLCGFAMTLSMDGTFYVGWMIMIGSLFTLSTIAYDEHDNCFPFLMTLPVSRREYACEKYLFGAVCGSAFWLFGVAFYAVMSVLRRTGFDFREEIVPLAIILLVPLIILDISIPFNLKYGTEKGRIYMIFFWGVIIGGVFLLVKFVPAVKIFQFSDISVSPAGIFAGAAVLTAAATAASVAWSVRIMEKKEF